MSPLWFLLWVTFGVLTIQAARSKKGTKVETIGKVEGRLDLRLGECASKVKKKFSGFRGYLDLGHVVNFFGSSR